MWSILLIAEKIITGRFIKNKIKVSGIGERKTSQMPDFLHFLLFTSPIDIV